MSYLLSSVNMESWHFFIFILDLTNSTLAGDNSWGWIAFIENYCSTFEMTLKTNMAAPK